MSKIGRPNPNLTRLQRADKKRESGEVHKQKAEVAQGKASELKEQASVFSAKAERYEDISANLAVRAKGMAKEAQQLRKQAAVEMRKAVGGRGMLALKSVAGGFGRMMNKLAGQELMTTRDLQKDPEAVATAEKLNDAARDLEINSTRFTNLAKAWATSAADMAEQAGALESRSEFHENVASHHMSKFGKAMRSARIDEGMDKVGKLAEAAGDGIRSGVSGALGWGAKVLRKGAELLDRGAKAVAPDQDAAPEKKGLQLEPKVNIDGVQYYDTPDNDLSKAGASLRVRTAKDAQPINIKPGKVDPGKIRQRVEVGLELDSKNPVDLGGIFGVKEVKTEAEPAPKKKGMIAAMVDQFNSQVDATKEMVSSVVERVEPKGKDGAKGPMAQMVDQVMGAGPKKKMSFRETMRAAWKVNMQVRDGILGLAKDGGKLFTGSGRQEALKFIDEVIKPKTTTGPESGPEWLAVAHGIDANEMSEGQLLDAIVDQRPKLVSGRAEARDMDGVKEELARRLGGDVDSLDEEHIKAAVDLRERAGLSRFTPSHEVAKQLKARGVEVSAKQVASDPAGIEL